MSGYAGRKHSSSTCQLCYNTSGKKKRGEFALTWHIWRPTSLLCVFFKKPTKNPPQNTARKTLFCINEFSGNFPFDFIRYRNRPQKCEYEDLVMYITITSSAETVILAGGKRKIINHWISTVQLAALGYRNYTGSSSFHHRTFDQNLSHTSEPSLSYTILILWTLRVSCLAANSHLENQNSRQVANKQIMSQALPSKRFYLVEFGFCLSLCIINIYLIISQQSDECSKSNLRKHYSKSPSRLSQPLPETPFNQPQHYCHSLFKVKTLPLSLSVRRKYVSFIIRRLTISMWVKDGSC